MKNSVNFKPFVALVAQWSMSEKILHMSLIRRGLNPTNPPTEIWQMRLANYNAPEAYYIFDFH